MISTYAEPYNAYAALVCRFEPPRRLNPNDFIVGFTSEEDLARAIWRLDDDAKQFAEKYQLKALAAISRVCPNVLDYTTWLSLRDVERRAWSQIAEEIANEISGQRKDQERKMDMAQAQAKSELRFPNSAGSSLMPNLGSR